MTECGPFVSVIVVTYNQDKTIARTLDSILAQNTSFFYEILIGDDASSDGTEEICRRYVAAYPQKIRYIRRRDNLGVLANYMDCVSQAKGEWVADCAGDDWWADPLKLQKQVDAVNGKSEISLVATGWREVCQDGEALETISVCKIPEIRKVNPSDVLEGRSRVHLCTALFRKKPVLDMLDKWGAELLANPLFTNEDQPVIAACAAAGNFLYLPDITLNYTVGHSSVSHRKSPGKRFDYSYGTLLETLFLQKAFDVNTSLPSPYLNKTINHIAAMAFASRDAARKGALMNLIQDLHPRLSWKSSLYRLLMRSQKLWHLSSKILERIKGEKDMAKSPIGKNPQKL